MLVLIYIFLISIAMFPIDVYLGTANFNINIPFQSLIFLIVVYAPECSSQYFFILSLVIFYLMIISRMSMLLSIIAIAMF
jgi:hypothetical protein